MLVDRLKIARSASFLKMLKDVLSLSRHFIKDGFRAVKT